MKKIGLFSSFVLSMFMLTGCFLIKPTNPSPENQDQKLSNFDQDFSEVASIFGGNAKESEATSFEFTTPEQELFNVEGKKLSITSSTTPGTFHDELLTQDRYFDETQSYDSERFEGLGAYSKGNTACLVYNVLDTKNLSQSQIDTLFENGRHLEGVQIQHNFEISCGDIQKAKKLTRNFDSLKIGDTVGGLLLKEKEASASHVLFALEGKQKVTGSIKMQESMDESIIINFTPDNISTQLVIPTNQAGASYSINLFEGDIDFGSFDAQTRQALLGGFELKVEITMNKFYHVGYFESEYYSDIIIEDYTILESETSQQTKAKIEKRSQEILKALKKNDMSTLANYINPEKGLRVTPYGHVTDEDVVLTREELIAQSDKIRMWGTYEGSGEPIKLTQKQYFERFVYNQDYLNAPQVIENKTTDRGTMIINIEDFYPHAEYREYFFPGFNPDYAGMDWEGLFLIFDHENYDLLGLAHEEWTP